MAQLPVQPVILCGGSGSRLWPLSVPRRPKPFLPLVGESSLLATTLARVSDRTRFAPPLLIGSADHEEALVESGARVILEPFGRNTAPAAAIAALSAARPEQIVLVMPSDHMIERAPVLLDALREAQGLAQDGWLMTFTAAATRPETGYGYVRRGRPLGGGAHAVDRFVEKPDAPTAARYLASGEYGWNCGIFMFRADRLIEELERQAPEVLQHARAALAGAHREPGQIRLDGGSFEKCPSVSIDVAVMEGADRVGTIPVDMGWSDVGSWDAVYAVATGDSSGNVIEGVVEADDVQGCYLRSDGPRIVVHGVRDLIVVATADGVIVTRRGDSQSVKPLVEREARRRRA
jgi:mannose-1-phosphate guanylyltransferase/mannose-1-phosphate guanylyltransferase/mannose-6-phosphate isomerase